MLRKSRLGQKNGFLIKKNVYVKEDLERNLEVLL